MSLPMPALLACACLRLCGRGGTMGRHRLYKERKYVVGQQLLTLRTRAQLTQAELAPPAGVSRRSIQNWENGEAYPKEEGLQQLIAVFLTRNVFTVGHER